MSTKDKIIGVFAILLVVLGFALGRCSVEQGVKIKYVEGATIRDTVYSPVIKYSVIPKYVFLPTKPDTVRVKGDSVVIVQVVDTAQIIAEYIKENHYTEVLFDMDTVGKLSVDAVVQFNKLQRLGYEYKPMQKQTTVIKDKAFTPFTCTSLNSLGYTGAGCGLYYRNTGASLKYITDFESKGVELGVQVKF